MFYINTALQGFILNPENTRNPASAYDKPVLAYHSCTAYDFQFLDSEGVPVPLRDSDTLTLALDKDYQRETPLMAWCGSAEIINAEQGIVSFLIDCSAESFYSNVKNGAMSPIMEIALYRGGDTRGIVLLQDTVTAKPRVQTTEGAPASGTPEYYNAAQVDALLKAGYEVEYSNDGETWGAAPDKVKFIRVRYQNLNGEWATIDVSSLSASAAGAGKSAYEIAVENGFEGDETAWLESLIGPAGLSAYGVAQEAGFPGTVHEWLTSLTGPQGEPGKNAYEVAQENGFTGTEEDFIASLKGEPGQDLKIDATGELSELDVYGAEPKGFTFAAAVTDPVAQTTKLYIYVKKSDSLNHWCNPTVITYYSRNGKDGENVKLIPPMEFKAPTEEDKSDYISFSLSKYPAAYVAAVCIDTADGEYKLPYNSAMGIAKIVKRSDGKTYVYFGNLVPEYETGRIYFSQGVAEKTLWMLYQEQGGKYSYNDFCSKIFELIGEGKTLTGTTVYVISGKQGEALTQALDVAAADGSDVSYAVTEGTLPAGLTLSGSTISGTPEENGTSAVTITASAGGATLEISVTFMIDQALKMYYGYVNDGATYKVSQITGDMLTLQTVTEADAGAMQVNVTAPAGAVLFVLVPADSGLTVMQDNGVGGQVTFNEDNGATGTGANGIDLTLNGTAYKAYGEFSLVDAETIIYIGE